eukprot:scaffold212333_cov21-Tisochrysis_lutea.AAC.2
MDSCKTGRLATPGSSKAGRLARLDSCKTGRLSMHMDSCKIGHGRMHSCKHTAEAAQTGHIQVHC